MSTIATSPGASAPASVVTDENYITLCEGIAKIHSLAITLRNIINDRQLVRRSWDVVNLLQIIIDIADEGIELPCKGSALFEAQAIAIEEA
jgi:hypothetical protein